MSSKSLCIYEGDDAYWQKVSHSNHQSSPEYEQFLDMMASITRWKGEEIPNKIGTVKLTQAVTLLPRHEHLVWGRLPSNSYISPGSTVIVEPTTSRSVQRNVLVGKVITPMWGDRWIPMKILNPTEKHITLKRNSKLADVSPCLAAEDFALFQGTCQREQSDTNKQLPAEMTETDLKQKLSNVGLTNIDIESCQVSHQTRQDLVQLLLDYQDVFSKHPLDCGEAKGFVHHIRLTDERPFRLPYRRVPPAHYQKLRQVLSEMEEQGIIQKSVSEFASPLVMVWKKDGGLRLCTDFRLLNARTVKDAHPLPHQSDCLAALGGNVLFSTMDLTSGFYNIPMCDQDKKYTAFTTPAGLYEYNRMAQGLSNSPASFMRMMLSIFGDLNFSSLLCYLDDLLVFAQSEEQALERLQLVFQRLREHNLRLNPKKCYLMRTSVKFLGHIIDKKGVLVDPAKVEVITAMTKQNLMEPDGCTPSVRRIRSFLGMVFYYQHFIPNCSSLAKPLFALTSGQKRRKKADRTGKAPGTFRKLKSSDWSTDCDEAFNSLKEKLLNCVVLAHPDFSRPFLLSVDASLDGLGAVLSQVPANEDQARPVAFASKTLSQSQKRYPAHRLEFLALKWSVCEKFSHWLKGHSFTVWTDNNPLTYIMTKPKLDACEQRWVAKLAPYSFDLRYIPGRKNIVADALSRVPFTQTVSHRLISEPYSKLLCEGEDVGEDGIQHAFRLKAQLHQVSPVTNGSVASPVCQLPHYSDSDTVKALCHAHEQ
uniref:ribonuclease H n=1 Tax=Astyanax mexicanus TaxID=7994 RepID=A0A3B1J038_ASTMX